MGIPPSVAHLFTDTNILFARMQVFGMLAFTVFVGNVVRACRTMFPLMVESPLPSSAYIDFVIQCLLIVFAFQLIIWPPWFRENLPQAPWAESKWKMHFRIVTRGMNKHLVADNCSEL